MPNGRDYDDFNYYEDVNYRDYDRRMDRDRDRDMDSDYKQMPSPFRPYTRPQRRPGYYPPSGQPSRLPQSNMPPGPPPSRTPSKSLRQPGLYAVDPGAIRGCRYRFTYIWLENGRSFWAWLVYVGRRSVAGYRWNGYRWVYFGTDLDNISNFECY